MQFYAFAAVTAYQMKYKRCFIMKDLFGTSGN